MELHRPEGTSELQQPSGGTESFTGASRAWLSQNGEQLSSGFQWETRFQRTPQGRSEQRAFTLGPLSLLKRLLLPPLQCLNLATDGLSSMGNLQRSEWRQIGHKPCALALAATAPALLVFSRCLLTAAAVELVSRIWEGNRPENLPFLFSSQIFFFVYIVFLYVCLHVYLCTTCLVPTEARGHRTLQN